MSIKQDRLDVLESQLANASVTDVEDEPRLYRVTVPGCFREETTVKADSRQEALDKTRAVLISKIEQMPDESTGEVTVDPRSPGKPGVQ